jgi:hypothetical protein
LWGQHAAGCFWLSPARLPTYITLKGEQNMKLNVYKNQHEIEKTHEVDTYDLMYGTVEDLLAIFDEVDDLHDNMKLFGVIQKNRTKLNDLLLDIFPEMTEDDLRKIKLKELIPLFMDLFTYVRETLGSEKN